MQTTANGIKHRSAAQSSAAPVVGMPARPRVAGLALAVLAGGLALTWWARTVCAGALAEVSAPGPASLDELLTAGAAGAALLLGGWLLLGVCLEMLALLPGRIGGLARATGARVTPAFARRVVALALGVGLATTAAPANALGASRSGTTGGTRVAGVAGVVATVSTLDSPDPGFAPDDQGPLGAGPSTAPAASDGGASTSATSSSSASPAPSPMPSPHPSSESPSPTSSAPHPSTQPPTSPSSPSSAGSPTSTTRPSPAATSPQPSPAPSASPGPDPGWSASRPRVRPGPDPSLIGARPGRSTGASERTVVVHRGDSLWSIAAHELGAGASDAEIAARWPAWWRTNRHVIGDDPDLVLPGQVLTRPTH